MCRRAVEHAREAQDAAADALVRAYTSICTDGRGKTLRGIYDETIRQALPEDFKELLGRLA